MPPEPLPWDRKDLVFKDRKHDRAPPSDALVAGGGSTPRWREPYHGPRDFPRASPRRPPPVHYRQSGGAGYHQIYPEESGGHGCTPSRCVDRFWPEDESFRPSSGRYSSGRSSCGSRENRGSFRRSPYWDSSSDFTRQHHEHPPVTGQRSVAVPITHPSPPLLPSKDQNDKTGGDGVDDSSATGQRCDRDRDNSLGSIGWKPMKWTRTGGLSMAKTSRSEVDEAGLEVSVPTGKETPVRSPVTSPLPSDDGLVKKKPRLGWGQGLAKYEKQKVEGSGDASAQNQSGNSTKDVLSETSPKVVGLAGSMSPATPCSAACNSSPGVDDRLCFKGTTVDNDAIHCSDLSVLGPQNFSGEFSIKLDNLPPSTMLTSLLTDLLQPEDACFGDSTFTKSTAIQKLLLFKDHVAKELEKTEGEIDLFEIELKSLGDENGALAASSDPSLQDSMLTFSAVTVAGHPALDTDSFDECDAGVKDADSKTPQTTSSIICKSASLGKDSSDVDSLLSARCPVTVDGHRLQGAEDYQLHSSVGLTKAALHGPEDWNHLNIDSSAYDNYEVGSHYKGDGNLLSLIMACNMDAAQKASQVFDKAFPSGLPNFDIWGSDRISSHRTNDMRIKEKLAARKRMLKFKERVLTLKFRAFHHLWKEDLRLLSIRKQRPKSQKRFELSSRSSQNGSQKHRSSARSRFTLPAGNLTLVPTTEIVVFASKLLSDSQIKLYRKNLKMPPLILDEKERMYSRFITYNSLVEDPPSLEKEISMINPWTQEETEVFMEMLATFGKDFTKISSFLNHKNTADCIEFYYKNHKSECFKDVKRRLDLRKQWRCLPTNTYLVTSGKRWNREANAASLDILGAVSVAAAHNSGNTRNQNKNAGKSVLQSYHNNLKVSRGSHGFIERASSIEVSVYEKEAAAVNVLAGICGALSSEAMSSCVTSSIDPPEKMNYVAMDRPSTPEVVQNIDEEDTCSDEGCVELESVDWTDEEKSMFVRALSMYGKDFARISRCVGTRSREQCKIFFSKARKCLGLDVIHPGTGSGGTPASDINGGRCDTDDGCPAEMDSAICSTQSCSKVDVDQSVANASSEGFVQAGNTLLQTETDRSSEHYDVGGPNQEEVEGKLDRLTSVNGDKLVSEGPKLLSGENLKEEVDASDSGGNEPVQFHESGFIDTKAEKDALVPVVSPVEPASVTGMVVEELKSETDAKIRRKVIAGSSVDVQKYNLDLEQLPVAPRTIENRPQLGPDASSSGPLCLTPEPNADGNVSHSSSGPNLTFSTSFQQQTPLELLSSMQKKSEGISVKHERSLSAPLDSMCPDLSSISPEVSLQVPSKSALKFEEQQKKQSRDTTAIDIYDQYILGNQSLNRDNQQQHILRGYPLQILNQKKLKRETDLVGEKQVLRERHSMGNAISQLNRPFVPDIHIDKSSSCGSTNPRHGTLFSHKSEDALDAQLRSCSQRARPEESSSSSPSHRTGDVKLFGQILSNPSLKKSSSSSQLQESDCQTLSPKQNKSASVKQPNSRKDNSMFVSRTESGGRISLEEVPLRSYGFWDGNRIQTGFSSLPESALMLAKLQGSVVGMPFYSAKDGVASSNGVLTDYQQAYVQPLSADGKRLDNFPELQRRSGFEMVSGFQQQPGRTQRLGVNMVGGGGILVGGGGVQDPVAVLKLQYAAATGNATFFSGEVESRRGDIGGR